MAPSDQLKHLYRVYATRYLHACNKHIRSIICFPITHPHRHRHSGHRLRIPSEGQPHVGYGQPGGSIVNLLRIYGHVVWWFIPPQDPFLAHASTPYLSSLRMKRLLIGPWTAYVLPYLCLIQRWTIKIVIEPSANKCWWSWRWRMMITIFEGWTNIRV